MNRIVLFFALSLLLLSAAFAQDQTALKKAAGGKYYGSAFRLNETENISTLFPPSATDPVSKRTITCLYEGLLGYNAVDLALKPVLAETFNISEDKKTYTFNLKKGVLFHNQSSFPNGKGREMTSSDVEHTLTFLCSSEPLNRNLHLFRDLIKGGKSYYEKKTTKVEGIKITDAYTIQVELERPSSEFLYLLADPSAFVYPKELIDKHPTEVHKKAAGTGPFYLSNEGESDVLRLKKNPAYHRSDEHGNRLPYLDEIKIRFIKDKKQELLEFKKGNLEMMYRLPVDYIIEIEEEAVRKKGVYGNYDLQRSPEWLTQCLWFNMQSGPGKKLAFRRAVSYAINRMYILEATLNGEGYGPAAYGVCPPTLAKEYNIRNIKGYDKNLDSARYYYKKSGYKNNEEHLRLLVCSDGMRNVDVAVEIQKQLKEGLNLDMDIEIVSLASLIHNAAKGKPGVYFLPLRGSYPKPQSFLVNFYSKNIPTDSTQGSYINLARYKNPRFDMYYEKGLNAKSQEEAFKNFAMAERVLMRDAAIVPLWYDEGYRLVQPYVRQFPNNALQHRDLSEVYFLK